jgi:pilus assembly protein Flp/PilA
MITSVMYTGQYPARPPVYSRSHPSVPLIIYGAYFAIRYKKMLDWSFTCDIVSKPSLPAEQNSSLWGRNQMNDTLLMLSIKLKILLSNLSNEEGQDLIEYALVVALIAFGAVAAMKTLSSDINNAFSDIGSELTSALA